LIDGAKIRFFNDIFAMEMKKTQIYFVFYSICTIFAESKAILIRYEKVFDFGNARLGDGDEWPDAAR
jgi:hypothetical protein